MFARLTRPFAARTPARKPTGFRPSMTALEGRDCPSITVDHPGAGGTAYSQVNLPLFSGSGPTYADVRQGQVGDCWLLAGMAEVAARSPNTIRSMFADRGAATETFLGKTYSVHLYDVRLYDTAGRARTVLVDTLLPGGGNKYDHPNGSLWVALAEKAYAQANGQGWVNTSHKGQDNYAALDSGYGSWSLQALTGRAAGNYNLRTGDLGTAWNNGQYVLLGTDKPRDSRIVGGHEYALVGYNPSSSQPYTVFNPWGTDGTGYVPGDHSKYGLFTCNAAFLTQNYVDESITRGEAGPAVAADFAAQKVTVTAAESPAATRPAEVKLAAPDAPVAPPAAQVADAARPATPAPAAADDLMLGVWVG